MILRTRVVMLVIALFVLGITAAALEEELSPAPITNDEGGAVVIRGEVAYTSAFFTAGVSEPLVILEDQTGFVTRNEDYLFPPESQVLGQITSDFFTSPFTYSLALPISPQAPLNDVDNDDVDDTGVMVFQVAYWDNTFGDGFLQERDLFGGGWSTAYSSAQVSANVETRGEYVGGKIVIYAPVAGQGFPAGFGDDGELFTDDDPLVAVPAGYTVVNMDSDPFTFDRSREVTIDLIEGEGAAADDFSDLGYTAAFDAMLAKFRNEYAFTEYKNIDWDALAEEYRPRFEAAEADRDGYAYAEALRDFTFEIPDGHIASGALNVVFDQFSEQTDGSIGIAIRRTSDDRIIANYIVAGSPADQAGMELGAEILAFDGRPVMERAAEVLVWSSPFSTDHVRELQQLRYVTRWGLGETVEVTFRNPDDDIEQVVELETVPERESWSFSSFNATVSGVELPVEWQVVGENTFLVKISSFLDDSRLTVLLWERMIRDAQQQGVEGIIIDMRNNGGGSGWLSRQMAAYFFQEPLVTGNAYIYDEELDEFYIDEENPARFYLPPEDLRFDGDVAVIVGPNCASACEFFSYYLTLDDRAEIVGHYPTGGLGGGVERFFMPDDIVVQMTITRAVDPDGDIHIEGVGVEPTIVVPVDEDTLGLTDAQYLGGDPLLDAAVQALRD